MIIFKNAVMIDPKSGFMGRRDIAVKGERIAKIQDEIPAEKEDEVIDCSGRYIGPGLVDVHVHFRDPGFTYKEDILSGSRAAAKGGFTSVVLMANTKPVVDNEETIGYILDKGKTTGIHVYTCATVSKGMQGKELNDFKALKQAGAIGFTDDGIPLLSEEFVKKAMEQAKSVNSVLSFHEEDPRYIENNGINRGEASRYYKIGGSGREAEITMIDRDLKLALETGAVVNFQHLSTAEAVELIRQAKKDAGGKNIHAEATPHHMALTQDAAITFGTLGKMNPPLRTEKDRQAILQGVADGTIDLIATDHAPHGQEEKAQDITKAPSGILGLETAFAIVKQELVDSHILSFLQLFCRMSKSPADLYHIDAGYLAENGPADLVVFDPERAWNVEKFQSKSQNSPFLGQPLSGKIELTMCKGKIVYTEIKS